MRTMKEILPLPPVVPKKQPLSGIPLASQLLEEGVNIHTALDLVYRSGHDANIRLTGGPEGEPTLCVHRQPRHLTAGRPCAPLCILWKTST